MPPHRGHTLSAQSHARATVTSCPCGPIMLCSSTSLLVAAAIGALLTTGMGAASAHDASTNTASQHALPFTTSTGFATTSASDDDTSDYSMTVSSTTVSLGDSVTVSWQGQESHSAWTGNYDWVAGYMVGACNGTDIVGEDTCYAVNEWAWVSAQGGASDGQWSFEFDGPGDFEFRISYCGCDECTLFSGDFAECSSCEYTAAATSPAT